MISFEATVKCDECSIVTPAVIEMKVDMSQLCDDSISYYNPNLYFTVPNTWKIIRTDNIFFGKILCGPCKDKVAVQQKINEEVVKKFKNKLVTIFIAIIILAVLVWMIK